MTLKDSTTLKQLDSAHHLHPFTDFKALGEEGSRIIVDAQGVYIRDADGNRILDAMAGLWCVNLGYGRKELVDAAHPAADSAAVLQQLLQDLAPTGGGAGRDPLPSRPAAHEPGVLHRFRLRSQ